LIDDLWKAKRTSSPKAIAQILSSPAVVTVVRKDLGRQGYRATDGEEGELVRAATRGDCH
jgi:hypothetical protein